MNTIPCHDVVVPPNRIRKDFGADKIAELADNILEVGLIHLPILRAGNVLVSGERRLRAIQLIYAQKETFIYLGDIVPYGMFPFASFESLSEDEAHEIELYENIQRVDLPWQVSVTATAELHKLKRARDPSWGINETTAAIGLKPSSDSSGGSVKMTKDKIVLAANLHRPEVRVAKTETEAMAALRKSMLREFEDELRKRRIAKPSVHTLLWGSAGEQIGIIGAGEFDLVVTDPPWGVGADSFGFAITDNLEQHKYDDSLQAALESYRILAEDCFAATKEQAHLYTFLAFEHWSLVAAMFRHAGWEVWPRPIIWYKHTGSLPKPDLGPRYVHEYVLFANKGNKPTSGLYPDVIDCPAVLTKKHAAEKPVDVYVDLLRRSAIPGDTVLDPFCGSGPIFPAAHRLGLIATGIDSDKSAIGLCKERLAEIEK